MDETLGLLKTWLRRAISQAPYLLRALSLVWAASRRWTLIWLALLIAQGLLPAATVTLTRLLVDNLAELIGGEVVWPVVRPTVFLAGLMAGVLLLAELLRSAAGWVRSAQAELVQDHIRDLIHAKSVAVDLAFYESSNYYDHLHRARSDAAHRPLDLLENMGSLLKNSITLIAMAGILVPYGLWIPVALLLSALPALYVALLYRRRQHRWWLRSTADQRRAWYYDWLLTTRETAAELRLFGLGPHFRSAYQKLRQTLRSERLRLVRDEALARLAAGGTGLAVTGVVMGWMIWQALQGLATLGDLALLYQAVHQGQGLARTLLQNLGQIYGNSLFLSDLFEFLSLEPQVVELDNSLLLPLQMREEGGGPEICFRDVTFRYPGSERTALTSFNLTIPGGQMAAVVGPNGAGKSTLVKLLCRFYDPQAGRIELDGMLLRDLPLEDLRQSIAVLFQEPMRHHATAAENIALGDFAAAPGFQRIADAARAAGADGVIERLPNGYETLLGRWFAGGTDLSVGEWQRIALARAFSRRASVLILDEPTSAMDSWAEADWLARLRNLAVGHTTLIITHRFTTAMHADVIHVMDEGGIVESGSHQSLLGLGGRYARSWAAQLQAGRRT